MPVFGIDVGGDVLAVVAAAGLVCTVLGLRWRGDRGWWRHEQERLSDEIWELRSAAAGRDRAEAASEAKSRFLATVSHEIRTPLNGILGMADLLRGTRLSDEQAAYVAAVRTSGEALATLIDEILDFSRIEAGRIDLRHEPFDLPLLVEGVVELLGPRAQDKGLEIASYVDRAVPRVVMGDGARLRQVLLNLAGNAIKFTDAGGVGLRVDCDGDQLRFAVLDTGPGVPVERREAIFSEFEQADNTTTRRHGGTGLGLAISSRIVSTMGGTIRYADRAPGGSRFHFAVACEAVEAKEGADRTAMPDLRNQRFVIVSRAPFTAEFLAETLRTAGAAVEPIQTAGDLSAHLAREPRRIDVTFVDTSLGLSEARAAADKLRAGHGGRIVMLMSPRERQNWASALRDTGDGWLVKPIRARSLSDRLGPQACDPEPRATVTPPVLPTSSRARGFRVLLAEDNPINALIARRSFERLGSEVMEARDGIAALQVICDALEGHGPSFDLVIMDVSMPGLDGLEVTRRVREHEARLGREPVRIVALTAHAMEEHLLACRLAGMDEVLTKPVAPGVFRRLIESDADAAAAG